MFTVLIKTARTVFCFTGKASLFYSTVVSHADNVFAVLLLACPQRCNVFGQNSIFFYIAGLCGGAISLPFHVKRYFVLFCSR